MKFANEKLFSLKVEMKELPLSIGNDKRSEAICSDPKLVPSHIDRYSKKGHAVYPNYCTYLPAKTPSSQLCQVDPKLARCTIHH